MPDPDPVLRLLWRHSLPSPEAGPARRGPKQKVTVDDVVDAAIDLADRDGLAALSMRGLAQHLGLGAMTLYTYVATRNDLLVLMVDQVLGRTALPEHPADLRERLELVARVQYEDCRAHPWLLEVTGVRAWLGPHMADRYEWQLGAVEGIGLDDIEMDQAVTLLASFGTSVARAEQVVRHAERESGMSDAGVVGGQPRGARRGHGRTRLPPRRPRRHGRGGGLPGRQRPAARARLRAGPHRRRADRPPP